MMVILLGMMTMMLDDGDGDDDKDGDH